MREFCYDMAYIAQYSPRPGATSARWDDDVPREEKERRFRVLSNLMQEIAAPRNQERVGRVLRVLVTSEDRREGYLSGYTEGRIPVRLESAGAAIGDFVDAEITGARPLSIEGRVTDASREVG
jgi:tRNA-2-methylthio-N6-dimethylallyladenosine synthase